MSVPRREIQVQKIYEAQFALEDMREIFRKSLPTGFDAGQAE